MFIVEDSLNFSVTLNSESNHPASIQTPPRSVQKVKRKRTPKITANALSSAKKKKPATKGKHQHLLLRDALNEVESHSEDEEIDVVILPPDNAENGDTDIEAGNDSDLEDSVLGSIVEVAGTLEVQSSKQTSKVQLQVVQPAKKKRSAIPSKHEDRKKAKEAETKKK